MATPNIIQCRKKEKAISAEYIRSILHYSPNTGFFVWKERFDVLANVNRRLAGNRAGTIVKSGHIAIKIKKRHYWAHRLAWLYMTGEWPKEQIDHKNLNSTDNSWENPREATHDQNNQNKKIPINCRSGVKGVRFVMMRNLPRYKVRISLRGKDIHLGYYKTIEEATAVRERASKKYYGEFSRFK